MITGATELKKFLSTYPVKVKQDIDDVLAAGAVDIARMATQDAPVNNGLLRNGISFQRVGPLEYRVFSRANYSAFIEFGTRKRVQIPAGLEEIAAKFKGGKSGDSEAAKEAIYEWCRLKGIPKEEWWGIFIHIMVNGIKPQPFFFHNYFLIEKKIRHEIITVLKNRFKI